MAILRDLIKTLGGEGSGNFGHEGRPGKVGGSASSSGSSEWGSSTYDKGGWGRRGRANIDRLNRATSKDHIMVDGISVDLDKAKSMVARNPNHLVAIRPAEKRPQPDTSADYSKHLHPDRLELMQREAGQKMQDRIEKFERSSRWKDSSYFRELRSMKQAQRAVANQNKRDLDSFRSIYSLLVKDKNPRAAKAAFGRMDTAARDDLLMMIPKGPARAALAKDLGIELTRAGRR
jgi:hypothetical protein